MQEKLTHQSKSINMFRNRSIIVDILAIIFGIGSWVGVNSTFIQLPLLVAEAPEGWNLPSYLNIMVQLGNLGPILYTLIQNCSNRKLNDAYMIYGLLSVSTVSALCTAFFYNKTAMLFGTEHSLALFILTLFTAINACTSSVLFMPYMGRFKEIYLISYFIGEGLSGFLPSMVALIQGIGGATQCILQNVTETGEEVYEKYTPPPRFGTMTYFIITTIMLLGSGIGFTLLDRLKMVKQQYAAVEVSFGNKYKYERDEDINSKPETTDYGSMKQLEHRENTPEVSIAVYKFLLLLIAIVSFFANGMFNGIQSYSCLGYSSMAYHLTATLTCIANPVACFLAYFLPHTSLKGILSMCGIASGLTAYVFVTAGMSPHPPLYDSEAGTIIVVAVWTMLVGLISYIKLCITTVMRAQGGKSLVWTGGVTQVGASLGAILTFVLINYTNSFVSAPDEC